VYHLLYVCMYCKTACMYVCMHPWLCVLLIMYVLLLFTVRTTLLIVLIPPVLYAALPIPWLYVVLVVSDDCIHNLCCTKIIDITFIVHTQRGLYSLYTKTIDIVFIARSYR
jgi:hypothetical protein